MSYCVYIGRNLTADGCAYLAGYGDEPSSHWLEVMPRQQHASDVTITVGVTPEADMPGIRTQIPQVAETARHLRVSYSYYKGIPSPITNGGLNEHGVAVRDVWSTSRQELIEMTPPEQSGPNYSDLARLVLERATSSRHGVELIGQLIAAHGYSTYGGNSHFIADHDEGWVVIEFAGGQGLWAAERIGPDDVRVSRPGYILEMPLNYAAHPDFMGAPNLIAFAEEQGWFDAGAGKPFNINQIYGDGKGRWDGIVWMEAEMRSRAARAEKISTRDAMWAVRTPRFTGDTAGYGQVVPLPPPEATESALPLRTLWHTQTGAVAAPFIPIFLGVDDIPPEYKQHRYLTTGESSRFVDGRKSDQISAISQGVESTRSAFRVFKRLLYLVLAHHERFLPEVTEVWEAVEAKLLAAHSDVIKTAATLLDAGEEALAARYLTQCTSTELMNALELAETLAASIEARTKVLYGIDESVKHNGPEQLW